MEAALSVQEKDKMADESPSAINLMAKVEQANFPKKKLFLFLQSRCKKRKSWPEKTTTRKKFLLAKNPPPLPKCKDGPLFL